jgi:hypothetical protein
MRSGKADFSFIRTTRGMAFPQSRANIRQIEGVVITNLIQKLKVAQRRGNIGKSRKIILVRSDRKAVHQLLKKLEDPFPVDVVPSSFDNEGADCGVLLQKDMNLRRNVNCLKLRTVHFNAIPNERKIIATEWDSSRESSRTEHHRTPP